MWQWGILLRGKTHTHIHTNTLLIQGTLEMKDLNCVM